MSVSLFTGLGDDLWFTQGYTYLVPVGGDQIIVQGVIQGSSIILQGYGPTLAPSPQKDAGLSQVIGLASTASAIADVSYDHATDLGRRRLGDRIYLSFVVQGVPPDDAPVAGFFDPSATLLLEKEIPFSDDLPSGMEFAREIQVSHLPLGKINVRVTYHVFGDQRQELFTFYVLPGDSSGDVQALYANTRPEAQYIIAQLTDGTIVQGRQPRL